MSDWQQPPSCKHDRGTVSDKRMTDTHEREVCVVCGAEVTQEPITLTEFLLARIAEDEAGAGTWYEDWGGNMEPLRDRVLAECEAKRRIIEAYDDEPGGLSALLPLANIYADHADFREEWHA